MNSRITTHSILLYEIIFLCCYHMTSRHSCGGLNITGITKAIYIYMLKQTKVMTSRHSCAGLHTITTSTVHFMCPRHCYNWMTLKMFHNRHPILIKPYDIIITTYQHPSFVVVKFQIFFIKKSKTVGQQNLSRELPPSTTSPTQFP